MPRHSFARRLLLGAAFLLALAPAPTRAQTATPGIWTVVFETGLPPYIQRPSTGLCFRDAEHGVLLSASNLLDYGGNTTFEGSDLWIANFGGSVMDACFVTPGKVMYAYGVELMLESSRPVWKKSVNGRTWAETTEADWNAAVLTRFGTEGVGFQVSKDRVIKTTDGGSTWLNVEPALDAVITAVHSLPGGAVAYAVGDAGAIFKTVNGGSTWTRLNGAGARNLRAVAFHDALTGTIAGEDSTLLGTVDGGLTWTRQKRPATPWNFAFLSAPVPGVTYVATADGYVLRCLGDCADGPVVLPPVDPFPELLFAPVLVAPAEGAARQDLSLTLSWNRPQSALASYVQVSTDSTFSMRLVDDSTTSAVTRLIGGLVTETRYYWRVRLRYAEGLSAWVRRTFTTRAGTIALSPPGPSAATGARAAWVRPREGDLEFRLQERARVRVRILDARGVLLAEPLNAARDSGTHLLALPRERSGHAYRFLEFRADDAYEVIPLGSP